MTTPDTTNPLQQQVTKLLDCVKAMADFAEKYGPKLPAGCGCFSISFDEKPKLFLSVGSTDADRERALTLYGEVFGRDGWTMEITYTNTAFDWKRTIDGVQCTIAGAEAVILQRNRVPVPPAKFPLQLTEGGNE